MMTKRIPKISQGKELCRASNVLKYIIKHIIKCKTESSKNHGISTATKRWMRADVFLVWGPLPLTGVSCIIEDALVEPTEPNRQAAVLCRINISLLGGQEERRLF